MAVRSIQRRGNTWALVNDDGSEILATPTSNESMWLIPQQSTTPPDPGEPPVTPGRGGPFRWPAPWSSSNPANGHPEDGFKTSGRPNHEGIDFAYGAAVAPGARNRAAADGRVILASWYYGYGYAVIMDHGTHNGKNRKTLYGHITEGGLEVKVGDVRVRGQNLGVVGNTGNSFGRHIHFETWTNDTKVDPVAFMKELNPTGGHV